MFLFETERMECQVFSTWRQLFQMNMSLHVFLYNQLERLCSELSWFKKL